MQIIIKPVNAHVLGWTKGVKIITSINIITMMHQQSNMLGKKIDTNADYGDHNL